MVDISHKTIVVVDNNPANLEILGEILTHEEYKVIKAHDGREGLFAAQQYQPDLMIIDKELPNLSSDELATQLKADKNLRQIPLLSVMDSSYKSCDLESYEDCITKPLSTQYLLETIKTIIEENPLDFSKAPRGSSKKVC